MAGSGIRFGVFDFDPATRELSREGVAVRLQAQPAQALALLIAQAGEVVTREALREAIWGGETFVDFDRNINFCIAQIRGALGDSAESPRYIRTLPKRGYQFIAPIVQPAVSTKATAQRGRSAAVIAAVLLAGGLSGWWLRPSPPAITIAVTRFDNETGDPAFTAAADALTDSVVAELAAAGGPRYGIIGNAAILRVPREQRDLLAIGSALHAGYVVIGQVQRDGSGIRVLAHLIHLPDQKHLWVVRLESSSEEALGAPADMARRIAAEFEAHLRSSSTAPTR